MHYFKKNIGDYAKKAGRLSMLQHGAYTLLIDSCYDREQFPTHEEAVEWTWASTQEELEAVSFVLRKFFVLENGVYVQNRIKEEIAEYHSKAEINKRIAIERETKRKEKSTDRAPVVHEPPPNQEPRTKNQEPAKSKAESATATATATRLPADWLPGLSEAMFCQSERPDLKIDATASRFRDYWIAQPGVKGRKVDWPATWRNWVRNEKQQARASPAKPEKFDPLAYVNRNRTIKNERTIDLDASGEPR